MSMKWLQERPQLQLRSMRKWLVHLVRVQLLDYFMPIYIWVTVMSMNYKKQKKKKSTSLNEFVEDKFKTIDD